MRLIDADALKEKINTVFFSQIGKIIDDAPTIDAVEVVRCRECRHAHECHKNVQYTRNEPRTITIGYSPIEFCSHGERSER